MLKILSVKFLYFVVGWLFDIGLLLGLVIIGFNKYNKWDIWFRRIFIKDKIVIDLEFFFCFCYCMVNGKRNYNILSIF